MRRRHESSPLHPQLAGFGGVEFVIDDERYGITEEALSERYADGEDIDDAMKLFRQHANEIATCAPQWARRRRGGLRMIFRDDVALPRSDRARRAAAMATDAD